MARLTDLISAIEISLRRYGRAVMLAIAGLIGLIYIVARLTNNDILGEHDANI